ncbi:ComEC/Rec2 family competence protein [Microbacterium testaceum]|uniref:ComEC/Rec2 family competence protein n=1 Tax=Microbacterium testaceum TaxID=2033 RepID=UPI001D177764|nr:MBL fold metallo-hydrolase [Microbacterium testaceum]MCC4249670.1 MBL fold metallo-hydrolase [Microbacterium testaceum]
MYEVDFLPVEAEEGGSTKSGDAICMRITTPSRDEPVVVVIDGGFGAVGEDLAAHIEQYYGTKRVDLVISTHPDGDHINGLVKVLENCEVGELMMHLPWKYNRQAAEISNFERIVELYDLAVRKSIPITEPFTGVVRFDGAVRVLGPTVAFYEEQLAGDVSAVTGAVELSARGSFGSQMLATGKKVLERVLSAFPVETLSDADETSARNKGSVITLVQADGKRLLFTGDAGIPSLDHAADEYERIVGTFSDYPLDLLQAPHHGSHRNVGPTVLNRILGRKGEAYGSTLAVISSAKLSEKHPSPKVTNALGRRGATVNVTEGTTLCYGATNRAGWGPATPVPPLEEGEW